MGTANSKKLAAKCSFLSKDEQHIVSSSFRLVSRNSERIKEDELTKLWGSQIDGRLLHYIHNYFFGITGGGGGPIAVTPPPSVDLERFAELFVFLTRGSADEKLSIILRSLACPLDTKGLTLSVPYVHIKEYTESVIASYMKILKMQNGKPYKSWFSRGCFVSAPNTERFSEFLTSDLVGGGDGATVGEGVLIAWLHNGTVLGRLLFNVFTHLYSTNIQPPPHKAVVSSSTNSGEEEESAGAITTPTSSNSHHVLATDLVPQCRGLDLIPSYPSVLDLNQILFVNAHLPNPHQFEWRFLFSSEIHGESFATLIGRIVGQGPTILLVEDHGGHQFGGFAPTTWTLSPNYMGDDTSFLYALAPKMRIYPTTGYNQHFQYLNLHQQTMPNGLGMGGQHGYCGLWLDAEYGRGHCSDTCTTYNGYQQMAHTKQFTFRHLEVWGVGPPPAPPHLEDGAASVLDTNQETRTVLEMAGRKTYSEGIRDVPPPH